MTVIPLDTAMLHLRAEEDDRAQVQLLLEAAEDAASQFINRRFYADAMEAASVANSVGTAPIVINPSITAACLLILGSLYANREDVIVGTITSELPMGSRSLLTPYRVGWGV